MYPPKQHNGLHHASRSTMMRNRPIPLIQIVAVASLFMLCILLFTTVDFGSSSSAGKGSGWRSKGRGNGKHGFEILGPKPYAVGDIDEGLRDVQNETLGFQDIFIISMPERLDKLDLAILATSLSDIKFRIIPGMAGKDVQRVTLPPTYDAEYVIKGPGINAIGAWRSELNAVRQIIADRLTSALILEDDIDWDVSLKNQLIDVARGGRLLSNQTGATAHSPYGDDWDVLWLGHCGAATLASDNRRFFIHQDPTVPPQHQLHTPWSTPSPSEWASSNGTRMMFYGQGMCTWAYAVSNNGAHKILKAMSVDPFSNPFDVGLSGMCGAGIIKCLTIYPPIFGAYAPVGDSDKESDINGDKGVFRDKGRTHNVAYSVKLNLGHLIEGEREGAEAQWGDMPVLKGEVNREYSVMEPGGGE